MPVVAALDTNCDPDEVQFGIPANDDAIRAGVLLVVVTTSATFNRCAGVVTPARRCSMTVAAAILHSIDLLKRRTYNITGLE